MAALDRTTTVDVIVIGAGFAGLYALHRLREDGLRVHLIEAGRGVGGVWYWNRYPGARVDLRGIEYSYSFSRELQQEWDWVDLLPAQPEVEKYLNWVADRLDLRRDITLSSRVTALTYDGPSASWTTETDAGGLYVSRFVVAATGCLSAPLEPQIPGIADFAGTVLYTSRFPEEGFDFTGKRVGVVGTGSSGVQSIPVIAQQAGHLTVFQRSAAYTRPAGVRPLYPGELDALKADYDRIRAAARVSHSGLVSFGAMSFESNPPPEQKILETPVEERLAKLDELGWDGPDTWADVRTDIEANRAACELYAEMIRRSVTDPETARRLTPQYPMFCKRQVLDTDYYATFNRDNVTLVDLREGEIQRITAEGIKTAQGTFPLDVIVFATGFDAITGALNRIDITGKGGRKLRDLWVNKGWCSYLGIQVAGFPNLFTIAGPGSPSEISNMVMAVEQHVDFVADCLGYMNAHGHAVIEATPEAQDAWVEHVAALVEGSIVTHPSCNSWYLGANVPGKRRAYMVYTGGWPAYQQKCADVAAAGYEGFAFGAVGQAVS